MYPVAQVAKNLPALQETQETQVRSLGWEYALEEGMATHPVLLPGESHGRGAWRSTVHRVEESDMTECFLRCFQPHSLLSEVQFDSGWSPSTFLCFNPFLTLCISVLSRFPDATFLPIISFLGCFQHGEASVFSLPYPHDA